MKRYTQNYSQEKVTDQEQQTISLHKVRTGELDPEEESEDDDDDDEWEEDFPTEEDLEGDDDEDLEDYFGDDEEFEK